MRREIPVDPDWWTYDEGAWVPEEARVHDEYFAGPVQDSALGLALDRLTSYLSDDERLAVELRVYGKYSFRAIAREADWWTGAPGKPRMLHGKKAHRAYRRGLRKLRVMIGDREWLANLTHHELEDE